MNKFMKTIALSMAMLCLGAGAAGAAQFSDAQSGKNLTAAQLASKLQKYDVVFSILSFERIMVRIVVISSSDILSSKNLAR